MHVFRHKRSDTFMCLSLFFAFVVCWIVIGTFEALNGSKRIQRNHLYDSAWEVIIDTKEFIDLPAVALAMRNLHGVVMVEDISIPVDCRGEEFLGRGVLFQDEGIKYSAGGESISSVFLNGGVLIGSDFEEGVVSGEISLGSEMYGVAGIEHAKWRSIYDHSLIVPYDKISETIQKTAFQSGVVSVVFLSDAYNAEEIAASFMEALQSRGGNTFLGAREYRTVIDGEGEGGFLFFYLLAYAFCIGNCVVAAELWALERKKEIAVRRAFGFSARQINRCLFREFLKLSLLSLLLASACTAVIGAAVKKQWLLSGVTGAGLLSFAALYALTAVLAVLPVTIYTAKGSSVNQMIQRG